MALNIPKISRDRIDTLLKTISPLVRMDGVLYHIAPCDPVKVSFTWDPKLEEKASDHLVPLSTIRTLHTYGYYGLFKPSISEVLAQIPEKLISNVVAFEVRGPDTAEDLHREEEALNAGFHVAETVLYAGNPRKTKPEKGAKPAKESPIDRIDKILG